MFLFVVNHGVVDIVDFSFDWLFGRK